MLNRIVWPAPVSVASGMTTLWPLASGVTSMMRAAGSSAPELSRGHWSGVSALSAIDRYDTSEGYMVLPPNTLVKLIYASLRMDARSKIFAKSSPLSIAAARS